MVKYITCISCPMGCYLTVQLDEGKVTGVSGNQCARGESYAQMECSNPVRMMTSTVRLHGAGRLAAAPVKSAQPVPKDKVVECVKLLKVVDLHAPVKIGDPVLKNVCGTGIDIIVTRDIPASAV